MTAVLDTNVLIRHLVNDHPDHSPRSSRLIARIQSGEVRAIAPPTVFFETNYILRDKYGLTRAEVIDILGPLVSWRSLEIADRRSLVRAFELYGEHNISFADAYHVALAEREEPPQLMSFDRALSRISTTQRIEP
jgi:predicted nucleic acid-binding protein